MSTLLSFLRHCREMAAAEHKPECDLRTHCTGCNPAADQALFTRLADEIDTHLSPQPDLFGQTTTPEPVEKNQ
ncbi:hypothetical protein [Nocardioides sp.]|uniref:hypothetical protein n=1 Tax=Nocardioides sp. TaxID=35761 RepID=UPI003566CAB4